MAIIIVLGSILVLTIAVWSFARIFSFDVCPICAGVSLTWLALLIGMGVDWLSPVIFQLPAAILMGGSVVGIAYKLENKLRDGSSQLIWKSLFIPLGFAFVYGLVQFDTFISISVGLLLLFTTLFFIGKTSGSQQDGLEQNKKINGLVEKMKKCC